MKFRRRQVTWVLLLALLAGGVPWLMSPATNRTPTFLDRYRREGSTNFDVIAEWIQEQACAIGKDILDPSLKFLPVPKLGPPGSLEIRVEEADGTACEGVRLALLAPPGVAIPQDLTTDANGLAIWKDLPSAPGYFVRDFSREGFERSVDVAAGGATRVLLARPAPRIEGSVLDGETRTPVEAAIVTLVPHGFPAVLRERPLPSTLRVVSTDRDGRFAMDVREARSARLVATTSDGRSGTTWGDFLAGRPVTIRVRALRQVRGRVVDGSGPRVGLRVVSGDMPLAAPRVTDVEGRFVLETDGLPGALAGTWAHLVVEGEGVPRFEVTALNRESFRVEIPDASLDVQVRDADTDQGMSEVTLSVQCGAYTTEATTDPAGRARVALSPDTIRRIRVLVPGRDPVTLPLSSYMEKAATVEPTHALSVPLRHGETRVVVLRMQKPTPRAVVPSRRDVGSALRLEVLDAADRPVPRVRTWGASCAEGDNDGRLVLPVEPSRVTAGELIEVQVVAPGFRRRTARLPVPREPRQVRDLEPLRLARLEMRTLRLVDGTGSPLPRWRVDSSDEDESVRALLSDMKGRVQVKDPSGDGSYLCITSPGGEVFFCMATSGGDWAFVRDDEIRIPPIREIRVRVLDPVGSPIEGAQVLVSAQSTFDAAQPYVFRGWEGVDTEGTVHSKQVAGPPLKVQARGSGFVPASVDLGAEASETVIVLRRRDEAAQQRLREALAERNEIDAFSRSRVTVSDDPKVLSERKKAREKAEDRRKALDEEIERLRSDGWNH